MKQTWFVLVVVFLCSLLFSVATFGNELAPGVVFQEDFETGEDEKLPAGWSIFADGDMRRTTDVAYSGKYSYMINDTDKAASAGIRSSLYPITAGKDYQVSSWVMVEGESAQLYLEFWDETKTKRLAAPWVGINASTPGWQYIVNRATAPDDAEYVSVIIYVGKTPVCKSYFDDIKVVDVAAYPAQ